MFEKYFPSAIEQYSFMQLLDAFEIRYINFTFQIMFYESRFVIVFFLRNTANFETKHASKFLFA